MCFAGVAAEWGTSLQSNDVDTSHTRADEGRCVLGSGGRGEKIIQEERINKNGKKVHIFCSC